MWRNYLTVGLRALAKNKTYAFINIVGLAIGLAACLLLLLYVRYETSYDEWLPGGDDVYQMQAFFTDPETGEQFNLQMGPYASQAALKKDFPQIEKTVYLNSGGPVAMRNGEAVLVDDARLTDGNFFDVVRAPFVKGDPMTALAQPRSVVLSRSEARRLFGNADAFGKTLTLVLRGQQVDHRVTGIFEDWPKNSHMSANLIARIDGNSYWAEQPDFLTSYGWQSGWIYVKLKPGTDAKQIEAQFDAWEKRNIPDERVGDQVYNAGDDQTYHLTNVRDVHLGEAQDGSATPGNDRGSIITFAVIAALILGMACVNFTNLATARASQRAREVALRKVLGADRKQLMLQFLSESVLVAAISMVLALALAELLLPALSAFLNADLQLRYFGAEGVILPVIVLVLLVGAAGGLYPAFYLSRFQPAVVLKANKSSAEAQGSGRLRNVLVVSQFAVSIGLIICTGIVYLQTAYARNSDPGYNREGILQVERITARQLLPVVDSLVREVEKVPGVVSVGRGAIGVNTQNNMNTGVQIPGRSEPVNTGWYSVDTNFFETMGIKLLAGRNFSPSRPLDDAILPFPDNAEATRALNARGINVVINELAAKRMGFRRPEDAIGKQVKVFAYDAEANGPPTVTIIGVVQDSRFRSIRDPIDPIMFRYNRNGADYMEIRYRGDPAAVRAGVEKVWQRFATDVPYVAEFSEDVISELYEAEAARAQTFAGFAVLAVIVACLGLFGLAAFTAERRTKEIGIRKVLGARTQDIVKLLAWQFSKPVIVANLIAWPVAWWVMRDWLNNFDTRIDLGPTPFLLAGLLALAIAIGTIAGHAFKVARSNPINALRYE